MSSSFVFIVQQNEFSERRGDSDDFARTKANNAQRFGTASLKLAGSKHCIEFPVDLPSPPHPRGDRHLPLPVFLDIIPKEFTGTVET